MATLSRGLGDFLTRLELEPLLTGGKFRGWRIVKLRQGDPLWAGVDLAPGDVVTSVNGRPIERPEQALVAFQSLAIASELRVAYERDGARREIVYPIDEEPQR
jgi:type II secretory pathway component PulC